VLWDDSGVAVSFFSRQNIPSDITAGAPVPDNWGTPSAFWPASSCNPFQFFQNHGVIFDTTLCGDWAGSAWPSTGVPGQEQSCAQRTGVSTCEAYVRNNGAALAEACASLYSLPLPLRSGPLTPPLLRRLGSQECADLSEQVMDRKRANAKNTP